MTPEEIGALFESTFGTKITGKKLDALDPWVSVGPESIVEVGTFARDNAQLKLDYLKNLSAVDYLIKDEKKAKKLGIAPHLEVVYHLFSFTHKHDFTLKVILDRWKDGKAGELPDCPTASGIWAIADWHEREAYDMMGIRFTGHPNLRRILCAEDWVGHPLRKDYEFPLEYHGIRCQ